MKRAVGSLPDEDPALRKIVAIPVPAVKDMDELSVLDGVHVIKRRPGHIFDHLAEQQFINVVAVNIPKCVTKRFAVLPYGLDIKHDAVILIRRIPLIGFPVQDPGDGPDEIPING